MYKLHNGCSGFSRRWPLILVAHRGASAQFVENSLQAINSSAKTGANAVEVDIRQTKDGQFVIFHDRNLKRIDGTTTTLEELSVHELNQRLVKANRPPALTLPRLKQEYNHKLPILFDLKFQQLPDSLVEILATIPFDFYLGARTLSVLAAVKTKWDRTRILAFVPKPATIETFFQAGAGIIRLWEDWVTPDLVLQVRTLNAQVWVMMGRAGSVGETDEMGLARIVDAKVDGIVLNDPNVALEWLQQHPSSAS